MARLRLTPPVSELPRPVVIASPAGPVFGVYHAPSGGAKAREGVVLCNPLGYESVCSQRAYREFAARLAAAGYACLRFDYHGTGDSGGDDRDPGRVEAMGDGIKAAISALRSLSGADEISLFGVRMGASLALRAAAEDGPVKSIVAWAPCVSGKAYLREMRAFHKMAKKRLGSPPEGSALADGDEEAGGYLMTKETVSALSELNLLALERAPARHILIIPREGVAVEPDLVPRLRGVGVEVFEKEVPGYSGMMVDQLASTPPRRVFDAAIRWLSERPAGVSGGPFPASAATSARMRIRPRDSEADVEEEPVYFGGHRELFGIVSESGGKASRDKTAVLFLSAGLLPRSGPNRLHTRFARHWAARGITCFRIDLAGVGDSRGEGTSEQLMFAESTVKDVEAAMDYLRATRAVERFILVGLCSGGYVAFHAGLRLESVVAEILLNPAPLRQRLHRRDARYYMEALFRKQSWKKALRGEVDFPRILGVLTRRARSAAKEATAAASSIVRKSEPGGDIPRAFREMAERGIDALLVFRPDDAGLRFLEKEFEKEAAEPGSELHLEIIAGADHVFSPLWSQERIFKLMTDHVARLLGK